jgi:hypothetical protein
MTDILNNGTTNGIDEVKSGLSREDEDSKIGIKKLNELKIKSRIK